jgi:hypothetical protein
MLQSGAGAIGGDVAICSGGGSLVFGHLGGRVSCVPFLAAVAALEGVGVPANGGGLEGASDAKRCDSLCRDGGRTSGRACKAGAAGRRGCGCGRRAQPEGQAGMRS